MNKSVSKFSFLMSNYNKAAYVGEAIESVLEQSWSEWELIIVDDCSTDDSVEIIKKYLSDRRIKLFKNKQNIGKIRTLKRLVNLAQGKILGILDSDDALAPDALAEIIKVYEKHPDCGYVYTQCWYCDQNLKPIHLGFSAPIPEGKSNLHVNAVVAMRTFKKEAYFKTSGYDEEIIFAEDIDLTLKMEETTCLYFLNKPLYYYRILPQSQSHSFKNAQINRSSTALAKLKAYQRRLGASIPNLNKVEISAVLFLGIFSSLLAGRLNLAKRFVRELKEINLWFFCQPKFWWLVGKKFLKILKLKLYRFKLVF
jgi:glycosyltransferase involved in cell wall biosynthesis